LGVDVPPLQLAGLPESPSQVVPVVQAFPSPQSAAVTHDGSVEQSAACTGVAKLVTRLIPSAMPDPILPS